MENPTIHKSAIIYDGAHIGKNVSIGPFTIVHKNVVIRDNTTIGSHCELGISSADPTHDGPLIFADNTLIRSHSIFYAGSSFGPGLTTGHRVTVRERTVAGQNLQIGTMCDIQGHCNIGDFVRFHSNVHIGQKSKIADFVWIFPYVVLTNDPTPPSTLLKGVTIEKFAAIATMSVILPGVTVGEGALVGALSSVTRNVKANTLVTGTPAKEVGPTSAIKLKDGSDNSAYPWRRHFHRGYDQAIVRQWIEEFKTSTKNES
jgi:acetyltransferase-like isoleucine patch superfamily enzyme